MEIFSVVLQLLRGSLSRRVPACVGLCLLAASMAPTGIPAFAPAAFASDMAPTPQIDNWWPVDGARISRIQPFKALLKDRPVDGYSMYWQVDDGQRNPMDDNMQDYPHKEARVDVTPWSWRGNGPYKVTFVAVGNDGQDIVRKDMTISIDGGSAASSDPSSVASSDPSSAATVLSSSPSSVVGSSSSDPLPSSSSVIASSQPSSAIPVSSAFYSSLHSSSMQTTSAVSSVALTSAMATVASSVLSIANTTMSSVSSSQGAVASVPTWISFAASSLSSSTPSGNIAVWWPAENVTISGTQPFKVVVKNVPLQSYNMTWDVDGGSPTMMWNSNQDAPHKEAWVDVSAWQWHGTGPYMVRFIAYDLQGRPIASQAIAIYNGPHAAQVTSASVSSLAVSSVLVASSLSSAVNVPAVAPTPVGGNPLAGAKLYVDPSSDAKKQADEWRSYRPADAAELDKIAAQPSTVWLGNWNYNLTGDVQSAMNAAASQGALPVFVAYNIPQRDCGGYSAGGAGSPDSYRTWIKTIANAIGARRASVILEPDALASMSCLSGTDKDTRISLLRDAVQTLKAQGNIAVYLDAGHPGWISTSDMASRLRGAGVAQADGFALNIANFQTDDANRTYGADISGQIGGKHFVIESSRNGLGPTADTQWCNPPQRALGRKPTTDTGDRLVDAYLWVKGPGGSDGQCNGGPAAGVWWPDYALGLAQRSAW